MSAGRAALRRALAGVVWALLLAACRPPSGPEQAAPQRPEILGRMSEAQVLEHSAAYAEGAAAFEPDPAAIAAIAAIATVEAAVEIDVFFGTWCSDSEVAVPQLIKILQAARSARGDFGLGDLPIRVGFLAVDREKSEPADLLAGKGIEKLPTFIVRAGGTEVGRIVESPEGLLEEELARLILEAGAVPPGPGGS